jgi:plasmid replication initiation protein
LINDLFPKEKKFMQKTQKGPIAVQSNSLVSARYRLSLGEQRMVLMMISKIDYKDEAFQGYEISIKELASTLEINEDCAYREAQTITDKLLKRLLRIQQPNGRLLKCAWIAEAIHQPGSVTLTPAPSLRPYLLELRERFTIVPLAQIKGLRSQYSVRIYMLLRQYINLGKFDLAVDDFREMLALEKRYSKFYELRRWVLDVAKKELDDKADISFMLETSRKGKTITTLKFIIIKNKKQSKRESRGGETQPAVSSAEQPSNIKKHKPDFAAFDESEKKLFNDFLAYAKKHDYFIYSRYLEEGFDMMVKYEYQKFLEK